MWHANRDTETYIIWNYMWHAKCACRIWYIYVSRLPPPIHKQTHHQVGRFTEMFVYVDKLHRNICVRKPITQKCLYEQPSLPPPIVEPLCAQTFREPSGREILGSIKVCGWKRSVMCHVHSNISYVLCVFEYTYTVRVHM